MNRAVPNMIAFASGKFLEGNDLRVQVVRHGDREEKQDKGETNGAPFLQTMSDRSASLMDPLRSPRPQQGDGDEQPEEIQ
jgi:hypothetical protein